ncbi:MAG: FAD-dependent oxidoreductase [Acidimicrobiia bacterium]
MTSDDAAVPEAQPDPIGRLFASCGSPLDRIAHADIVPLLLVYTHFTGDTAWLDRCRPFIKGPWSFDVDVPDDLAAGLRRDLVAVLETYRDEGRPMPARPPVELLRHMLDVAVGHPVTDAYMDLVLEEMNFEGGDPKRVTWRNKPDAFDPSGFTVAVIGAGYSGLDMAAKLKDLGLDFVVFEKNDEVGGTWYENSYPGCAVDTPNHFYSYSFRLNPDWNYYFARRDEILGYIKQCYREMDIAERLRFNHEVLAATWNDDRKRWTLRVRKADGSEFDFEANAVVTATGLLNKPSYPDIAGLDRFTGPKFHSSRWDHSVDLTGKNVAMIGTGASGLQIAPQIAPIVGQLVIFQRTPHWAIENKLLFQPVHDDVKWAQKYVPYYARWFRLLFVWASSDFFYDALKVDPDWTEPATSLNALSKTIRERLETHIRAVIGDDPVLLEKVIPKYPPYGKRMLRDSNWYRTLTRENVELITGPVKEITESSIVGDDGVEHPVDVIIMATGFQAQMPLWPIDIVGTHGSIRDHWGTDDPRAHLGITVPGFPNMFILYGPNTNGGHGGSAVFHSECQVRYTLQALREMIEREADAVEVRREPYDDYNETVDAMHRNMVWAHPGVTNWYRNKSGRVVTNSPWRIVDYRNLTADFHPEEYEFSSTRQG